MTITIRAIGALTQHCGPDDEGDDDDLDVTRLWEAPSFADCNPRDPDCEPLTHETFEPQRLA